MAKFWPTLKIYNAFRLGGSPWQYMRYKVEAEPCKIYKLDCFFWYNKALKKWVVHELSTGSYLGEGKTPKEAKDNASYNYRITDDLKDQIATLLNEFGGSVKNCSMITTMEAERLLKSHADIREA